MTVATVPGMLDLPRRGQFALSPHRDPEIDRDLELVPARTAIRVPIWVLTLVAMLVCFRDGHVSGRVTLQRDGHHHCLCCGKQLDQARRR